MARRILWTCALGLAAACGESAPREPELQPLTDGRDAPDDATVSPDGRSIVFTRRIRDLDQLWVADIDGRNARALFTEAAEDIDDPAWSPDGKTVAFSVRKGTGGDDLYAVPAAGGAAAQLTSVNSDLFDIAYAPDGSQIAFTSNLSGRLGLWTIPSAGGPPTQVAPGVALTVGWGRWSPDGKRMAFQMQRDARGTTLAVVDMASGVVTPLTTEGFEFQPEWSPDGNSIVYTSGRTGTPNVWMVSSTGGAPRQLTMDVRGDFNPRFSPDGRWIAYQSQRGGQRDVWILPLAGGDSRRVTNSASDDFSVNWTRDGSALVMISSDQLPALFDVPLGGGTPKRLTDERTTSTNPRLSPDGRLMSYLSVRGGLNELFLKPRNGGEERPLVTGSNSTEPTWSPDGSMVAFVSLREPLPSVWVVRVSDGKQWRASPEGQAARFPQWLPDSRRLSYIEGRAFDSTTYMIVEARGGTPTRLMTARQTNGGRWSPDGSSYVFNQRTGVGGDVGIYRVPVTGGTPLLLTAGQKVQNSRPIWSDDGSQIAYTAVSPDSGTTDLFVMEADGSNKRRITFRPAVERNPTFSADGKELIFVRGLLAMEAVNLETGAIRTLFDGDLRIADWSFSLDRSTLVIQARIDKSAIFKADVRALMREER